VTGQRSNRAELRPQTS